MPYCISDKLPVNTAYFGIDYPAFSVNNLAQDLSGSLSGAGGIGGLISVTRSTSSTTETFYPLCDGNGNISDYVDTNGNVIAHKEFDAYGNTIASSGAVSDFNFWFSSKYYDSEINAYFYGYRWYSPTMARWMSRDPIQEIGGKNLYAWCRNNGIRCVDSVGLIVKSDCPLDTYLNKYLKPKLWLGDNVSGYTDARSNHKDNDRALILIRMFRSKTVFTVNCGSGSVGSKCLKNIEKHVDARVRVIENARNAKFTFGSMDLIDSPLLPIRFAGESDETYLDRLVRDYAVLAYKVINSATTQKLGCQPAAALVFSAGIGGLANGKSRDVSHASGELYIPGDWGQIDNEAWTTEIEWGFGKEGLNFIYVKMNSMNEDLYWVVGSGDSAKDMHTYSYWEGVIGKWKNVFGDLDGKAAENKTTFYPKIGLK